jgi:hypothetical protein
MRLKKKICRPFDTYQYVFDFPSDWYLPSRILVPKMEEAFNNFELAIYNDLQNSTLSIQIELKNKVLGCITLAEKMHDDYINEVREIFNKMTDEEIFNKTSWDDNRLPIEEFEQLILSQVDNLIKFLTCNDYKGEIIEYSMYPPQKYINGGRIKSEKIGTFKAPSEYITLKYDTIHSLEDRARLDESFP